MTWPRKPASESSDERGRSERRA